jgi:hypothetical protein
VSPSKIFWQPTCLTLASPLLLMWAKTVVMTKKVQDPDNSK